MPYLLVGPVASNVLCRTGALTLMTVITVVSGCISAAVPFLKGRSLFVWVVYCTQIMFYWLFIYRQERVCGYYSVSAYFISKLIFELFPVNFILRLIFSAITYWMIGMVCSVYVTWSNKINYICFILYISCSTSARMILWGSSNLWGIFTENIELLDAMCYHRKSFKHVKRGQILTGYKSKLILSIWVTFQIK